MSCGCYFAQVCVAQELLADVVYAGDTTTPVSTNQGEPC